MYQPSLFDLSPPVYTVSEINTYLRQKLEADPTLQSLYIEGEISNWKPAGSGHIYFTLKDAGANIRCVIWRSQARSLLYLPQREGELVRAHGRISVYEAGGNYQFYVDDLEAVGQGALYAQFERLKARLAAEGLFAPELKQALPEFPRTIGIVTSPDAAALRDVCHVLRRRYPLARVILSPTPVQGETAPPQIIAALEAVIRQEVDVIILTRGGGSLEDLWAFNDESLARAVARCPIPVVTGVGHEVDFTIVDFVADVRAPTPSAAAELASPDRVRLAEQLEGLQQAMVEATSQIIAAARVQLQNQQWFLSRLSPTTAVNNYRQGIDQLLERANRTAQYFLQQQQTRVDTLTSRLETLNPQATLARGYAVVQKGAQVVTQTDQVQAGDELVVQVRDGGFGVVVAGRQEQEGVGIGSEAT